MKKILGILKGILKGLLCLLLAAVLIASNTLLPTYGRMINEILTYKQQWKTPNTSLDTEYNKPDYTKDEIKTIAQQLNEEIVGEGVVLLENNAALPLAKGTKLSLFSHSSVDVLAGGYSGSSLTLKTALENKGFEVNETLWNFYKEGAGKTCTRGPGSISYGRDENFRINECPMDVLLSEKNLESTFQDTTAIFVWSRVVGEGRDMPRSMYNHTDIEEDKSKSYLEPDSVELGILSYLNEHFDNVILLINSPAAMELGWTKDYEHITGILQMGLVGTYGLNAVAGILAGEINPSGHLVDTIAYDAFSSPAAQNYGDYMYVDEAGNLTKYAYLTYAEGIYVGYRYYETRYEDKVLNQGNPGDYDYTSVVQYPFGYGLSYTDFTWSDFQATWDGDTCTVSVKVQNTGTVAGKDVIQVYIQKPYTDYDRANGIEKASVELVAYVKTGLLEPGASGTYTASFTKDQLKSYDSEKAQTYVLDAGDYYITAASNAHTAINNILSAKGKTTKDGMDEEGNASFTDVYTVAAFDSTTYAKDSYSGNDIHNLFDDAKGDFPYLTRNDWVNTFPQHDGTVSSFPSTWGNEINGTDGKSYVYVKTADAETIQKMDSTDSLNPNDPASYTDTPVFAKANNLELIQLRGKDYNDPMWEDLLDQLTEKDLDTIVNYSGYGTIKLDSIQKPHALDADSATGLVFGDVASTTFNGAEVTAQTWNIELAEKFGSFIGNDALLGNINGWYAPATNIHRTPFSGRNNEYYSEDPFISGYVSSVEVKAAASKGTYTYIKHFALNDQENHRGDTETEYGACTFANEQSIREIYVKPFEMCMKVGDITLRYIDNDTIVEKDIRACQAVMTAFNRLGYTWTGGNYNLITGLLRNEWTFNGFIITDAETPTHMDPVQMITAGADGKLNYSTPYTIDLHTPYIYHHAREAAHHFLYTIVNSNAMNNVLPGSKLTGKDTASTLRIALSAVSILGLGLIIGLSIRKRIKKA